MRFLSCKNQFLLLQLFGLCLVASQQQPQKLAIDRISSSKDLIRNLDRTDLDKNACSKLHDTIFEFSQCKCDGTTEKMVYFDDPMHAGCYKPIEICHHCNGKYIFLSQFNRGFNPSENELNIDFDNLYDDFCIEMKVLIVRIWNAGSGWKNSKFSQAWNDGIVSIKQEEQGATFTGKLLEIKVRCKEENQGRSVVRTSKHVIKIEGNDIIPITNKAISIKTTTPISMVTLFRTTTMTTNIRNVTKDTNEASPTSATKKDDNKSAILLIVGPLFGVLLFVVFCLLLVLTVKRRRLMKKEKEEMGEDTALTCSTPGSGSPVETPVSSPENTRSFRSTLESYTSLKFEGNKKPTDYYQPLNKVTMTSSNNTDGGNDGDYDDDSYVGDDEVIYTSPTTSGDENTSNNDGGRRPYDQLSHQHRLYYETASLTYAEQNSPSAVQMPIYAETEADEYAVVDKGRPQGGLIADDERRRKEEEERELEAKKRRKEEDPLYFETEPEGG